MFTVFVAHGESFVDINLEIRQTNKALSSSLNVEPFKLADLLHCIARVQK